MKGIMKHLFTIGLLLSAFQLFAQPANDDCPGIVDLGPAPICPPDVIYNNLNATTSDIGFDNIPPCWVGGIPNRDVWFSFVAVDTILDYRITVTACPDPTLGIDPMLNPQIAIYRGDCEFNGLQLLDCETSENGDGLVEIDLFGLTPGITYFVRINDWSASASPNDGAFKLCIIKKPPVNTVDDGGSSACSGTLYDSGGPDEDYGNDENFTYTICPTEPHNCINFTLDYYNIEAFSGDALNFYDGPNTSAPLLGSLNGGDIGPTIGGVCYAVAAQSGCLTVQFISDGASSFEGFQGFWECTSDECPNIPEIDIETGSSPEDIVESVVSGQTNVTITSIVCDGQALGVFEAGVANDLGLDKGILLSTGPTPLVANPGAFILSNVIGTEGDADLDYLSQQSGNPLESFDACVVEMDVFAATDEITFEYIFGSDEYPEWVGDGFNDIFAFLVSGPGITGDPNIGNQQNIATLPDGTFIQIDNVNEASNWQYYRNNENGQSVAYDGLTSDSLGIKKSLTARIATIPCNTYRLKFAIADRGDASFDSGVFISEIKGGSPQLGVNFNSGIEYLAEECVNTPDEIFINLNNPVDQPTTYDVVLSGTATQGVDYTLTLPGSVTFTTGQEVFAFPIQALSDGLVEGTETIIIQLVRDFGCGATVLATLEIELHDNLVVEILENEMDTVLVCGDNGAQLSVSGGQTYFWQPPGIFSDPNISNPIVSPDSSMWVSVTGSLGICTDADSIYLNVINPEINIIPEGDLLTICENDSIVLTAVNNVGNSNLEWSSFFIPIPDPSNPVLTVFPPAFFNFIPLTVQVELGGCIATDNVTVNVDAFDFPVVANDTTICQNYSVDLGTDIIGTSTTYEWTPSTGLTPDGTVSGPLATPDVTTTYTLIAESATGVCKDTAEVTITVIPVDLEILNPDTTFICIGESATLNSTNTTGGVGVVWTPNFFLTQNSPEQVVVTPPVSTWYFATLSAGACTVVDSVLVYVDSLPDLSIMATPAKESYCIGEEITLTSPTYEPGNFPGIELMWDAEIPGALTPDSFLNLVLNAIETHTYVRTTTVNACTSVDSIEIIVTPAINIEIVPGLDTICPGEQVQFSINGPAELTEFSWDPTDDLSCSDCRTPIASPGQTTTYTVMAEFEGCPVSASALLFVPSGPLFNLEDAFICPGDQIQLNSINNPQATYVWTASDGSLNTTDPTPTVSPTQATTYTVTATIGDCVDTDMMTVTVATDFTLSVNDLPVLCPGGSGSTLTVTVNPSGPNYTYVWKDNNGNPIGTSPSQIIFPGSTTSYTVEVSDANGCFENSLNVQVEVSPVFTVDAQPTTITVTAGTEVDLTGTASLPGISFTWTDAAGAIISNEANTSVVTCEDMVYTLTGTDANGCTAVDNSSVFVTEGFKIDSIVAMEVTVNDSTVYEGEEYVLVVYTTPETPPGSTFNWFVNDTLVSTTNDTISAILNAPEIFGPDNVRDELQNVRVEILNESG
ncbi:MAG: choice-of-anchor L domain-containing protein, partial [Saprospiraceae bacterium]|nr:choice-of-anchor L domain-containing protein [Saprospiraceae bacterium]